MSKSSVEKAMGACVWCMEPVFAVAAPVRCANNGEWSGQCYEEAAPGEREARIRCRWLRRHSSGEIGAADSTGALVCSWCVINPSR